MKKEEWKEIDGYGSLYFVSNHGSIKSTRSGKKMAVSAGAGGYLKVSLTASNGVRKTYLVHRLVAFAFIGAPKRGQEVDHVNGDARDNRADNLRWVLHFENVANPITRERYKATLGSAEFQSRMAAAHRTGALKRWKSPTERERARAAATKYPLDAIKRIVELRKTGFPFPRISAVMGLSVSSVKHLYYRRGVDEKYGH